jgi:hypothetical protein
VKPERNIQILTRGLKASHEQMFKHPQRREYPHDFDRLYEWLEDKVFNLYEAIQMKKTAHTRTVAADIIVTACEMIELAEMKMLLEDRERKGGKK